MYWPSLYFRFTFVSNVHIIVILIVSIIVFYAVKERVLQCQVEEARVELG